MYDAVQNITGKFKPYHAQITGASGSPEAAIAKAADDTLVNLWPNKAAEVGTAYKEYLTKHNLKEDDPGVAVGQKVAADILAQLAAQRDLQPARAMRDTAVVGVVLVDGQVDHTTGLLMLREAGKPWRVWCTDAAYADLTTGHPVLRVLAHYSGVDRRRIDVDGEEFDVDDVDGVRWRAVPVASKPAPYSPHRDSPAKGDNIALLLTDAASERVASVSLGEAAASCASRSRGTAFSPSAR